MTVTKPWIATLFWLPWAVAGCGTQATLSTPESPNGNAAAPLSLVSGDPVPENTRRAVGGGYTSAGLKGEYFANTSLSGTPAFERRDVRIDFHWGRYTAPGGSISKAFASVKHDNFSVRWTGRVIPAFSEDYTFKVVTDDGARLFIRPDGTTAWTTLVDNWTGHAVGVESGIYKMEAGKKYEIRLEYFQGAGEAVARLLWTSPSTPLEVIDALQQTGINNPEWRSGFTNIVKGARNSWQPRNGATSVPMDANGWPMADCDYVFQESLNQGLDVDPLMAGTIAFRFNGSAKVGVWGNVSAASLTYAYDPATNTTTGSFKTANNKINSSVIQFSSTSRDGTAGGPPGITNLKLMRPIAPNSTQSYPLDESVIFTPEMKKAMEIFTIVRHQYVANNQAEWADRTPPTYFNQSAGTSTKSRFGVGQASSNQLSWEYKVMFANETGRDLMISIPTLASGRTAADVNSYLVKLAQLLRYGSDGVNPYTTEVANPKFPPLNSNLRVYLEIENELWNWFGPFYFDYLHVNKLMEEDVVKNTEDFKTINFDNKTTAKNDKGEYLSMGTWRFRKIMHRTMQMSDIFRAVFGDRAMHRRIRPLYEWQYDNANGTATLALDWADQYFNNGDGIAHVTTPRSVSHWIWGGGGAAYYGAKNGTGKTTLLAESGFESPVISGSLVQNPTGSAWTFTGTAGLAHPSGTDGLPPPHKDLGSQYAFIKDKGEISVRVTFPATASASETYGLIFRAVARKKAGAGAADTENLRVFLDDTTDLTAKTASQGNGYTPVAYDSGSPWFAQNVWWVKSEYYYTRTFKVTPGSTHKITIRGMGSLKTPTATDQMVFLDDVRITSMERLFGDGIPGGGEATGQPAGQNYQRVLNIETNFAKAFNLEMLAYESGWSLGGDDGGSWLQNMAKYGDYRARDAQLRAIDAFNQSGAHANVFGTYPQWPTWSDYFAEQGLLDVKKYPIIQAIYDRSTRLPAEPNNGTRVPAVIGLKTVLSGACSGNAKYSGMQAGSYIEGAGTWLSWNILTSKRGAFTVSLKSTAATGSKLQLLVDDAVVASGTGGAALSARVNLTKGLHTVRVRSLAQPRVSLEELNVSQ